MSSKKAKVRLGGQNQDDIEKSTETENGDDGKSIHLWHAGSPILCFFFECYPSDDGKWQDADTI